MSGEELKQKLLGRGYVLADIAKQLGMSPQHLNQALNAADIKSGLIERICCTLKISIGSLYGALSTDSSVNIGDANISHSQVVNGTDTINRLISLVESKDKQIEAKDKQIGTLLDIVTKNHNG